MLSGVIKTVVTQGRYEPGGFAERITWDQAEYLSSGKGYVLTTDPRDAGLYFKFGSVVAVFSGSGSNTQVLPGANTSTFNASIHIPWQLLSSVAGTDSTGWATIPFVGTHPSSIDDSFHTAANVKAGLGDPCRLVGLDLDYIKNTMTTSETDRSKYDNGIWRLPTDVENGQFTAAATGSGHWWTGSGGANPSPFGPLIVGSEFPNRNTSGSSKFLPANGWRIFDTGTVTGIQAQGRYWGSRTVLFSGSGTGNALGFNSGSVTTALQGYDYKFGFGVRCVRQ